MQVYGMTRSSSFCIAVDFTFSPAGLIANFRMRLSSFCFPFYHVDVQRRLRFILCNANVVFNFFFALVWLWLERTSRLL